MRNALAVLRAFLNSDFRRKMYDLSKVGIRLNESKISKKKHVPEKNPPDRKSDLSQADLSRDTCSSNRARKMFNAKMRIRIQVLSPLSCGKAGQVILHVPSVFILLNECVWNKEYISYPARTMFDDKMRIRIQVHSPLPCVRSSARD